MREIFASRIRIDYLISFGRERERERDRERERERETFGQNRKEIDRPKLFVRNLYGRR